MKKRLLASILSLAMVFSLVPVSALAEDEEPGGDPAPVCTCEARCTGETVDETCPVCAEDITLCAFEEAPADEGKPTPCTVTEGCTLEAGHEGECVLPGEPKAPADDPADVPGEDGGGDNDTIGIDPGREDSGDGLTAVEQLAEMIAALPDYADVDEADLSGIYAAQSAYEALSDDEKASVDADLVAKLEDLAELAAEIEEILKAQAEQGEIEGTVYLADRGETVEVTVAETGTLQALVESTEGYAQENVVSLTISTEPGAFLNYADFTYLRTQLPNLTYLDLTGADCLNDYDPANPVEHEIPTNAMVFSDKLETIILSRKITSIGHSAFYGCISLRGDLVIPDNITNLSGNCFGFTGKVFPQFDSLTLSQNLENIGAGAFLRCKIKGGLTIPAGVEIIGGNGFAGGAFQECVFEGPLVFEENSRLRTIGSRAFSGCGGLSATTENLPTTVETIGSYAFSGMKNLTGVLHLPNVVSIGVDAFNGCSGLTGVTFGENLVSIEKSAFNACGNMRGNLVIPDSTVSVGDNAFLRCYFDGTLTLGKNLTTIGDSAFREAGFTGDLVIPDSVTSLGTYAFYNCGFDGTLTLSNALEEIPNYAFYNCQNFTGNLVIPDSVTSLGTNAFYNCGFDGTLTLSNALEKIQASAFYYCKNFTGGLTIPDSVAEIGQDAFNGCAGLNGELQLGGHIQSIGKNAFAGLALSGEIKLPESLKTLGQFAFLNCKNLTGDVTLPADLESIGVRVFDRTQITALRYHGDQITNFGDNAYFGTLSALQTLDFGESKVEKLTWTTAASALTSAIVPDTLTSLVLTNKSALQTIDLTGCTDLKTVDLRNNAIDFSAGRPKEWLKSYEGTKDITGQNIFLYAVQGAKTRSILLNDTFADDFTIKTKNGTDLSTAKAWSEFRSAHQDNTDTAKNWVTNKRLSTVFPITRTPNYTTGVNTGTAGVQTITYSCGYSPVYPDLHDKLNYQVTLTVGDGGASTPEDSDKLTVVQANGNGINATNGLPKIYMDMPFALNAKIGTNFVDLSKITWTIYADENDGKGSDTSDAVLKYNEQSGLFEITGAGTAWVTATYSDSQRGTPLTADIKVVVAPRAYSVNLKQPKSKVYGADDPVNFFYGLTVSMYGKTEELKDVIFTRDAGEDVGTYQTYLYDLADLGLSTAARNTADFWSAYAAAAKTKFAKDNPNFTLIFGPNDANLPNEDSAGNFTITARALAQIVRLNVKNYDGTTDAQINTATPVTNILPADLDSGVSVQIDAKFDNADVKHNDEGAVIPQDGEVIVTLTGAGVKNYALPNGYESGVENSGVTWTKSGEGDDTTITMKRDNLSAIINPLTVSCYVQPLDKVYDGTTTAGFESKESFQRAFTGLHEEDQKHIGSITAAFSDKNAGDDKTVTLSSEQINLDNYKLPAFTASITPRPLFVTGLTASDKAYDGTAEAKISGTPTIDMNGVLSGDTVFISSDGSELKGEFYDKNAGNKKSVVVSVGFGLTGEDAENYYLQPTDTMQANITPATLTITPDANQYKSLGALDPAFTYTYEGLAESDKKEDGTAVSGILRGALSRVAGEASGEYAFALGSLTASSNYKLVLSADAPKFAIRDTDATLKAISVPGGTLTPTFNPEVESYTVKLPKGTTTVPTITAEASNSTATVNVSDAASLEGSTTITVTAADGQTTKTYTISFSVAAAVSVTASVVNASSGNSDGIIVATGSGGSGSYEFSLDNATWQSGNTFVEKAVGSYTLYVRDREDHSNTAQISVTVRPQSGAGTDVPAPTTLTAAPATPVIPYSAGSLNVELTAGGVEDAVYRYYIYFGTGSINGNILTVTTPGTVTVIAEAIKDGAISTGNKSLTLHVEKASAVSMTAASQNVTTYGGTNGSIAMTASGGLGTYQYRIGNGSWGTTSTFSGLTAGTYTVYVRDAQDTANVISQTVEVTQADATDAVAVNTILNQLTLGDTSAVTESLALPTSDNYGGKTVSISWTTSDSGVVSADGTVTRPSSSSGNTTVTLTATLALNGITKTKTFEVTVLAKAASSSGGGSGSGSSSSTVSVDSGRNGSVTVSPKNASKGTTVTITVKPDKGYELDELTVTDSKGNELKLTKKSDTRYTFTMPSGKVTVEASFAKIEVAPDEGLAFVDVPANAYYADAVAWAVENGITSGTSATTFSPNAACTRAQMVTFLWRAAGSPKAAGNNPFTDLDASAYYYDAVLWAVSEGITSGTSATTFGPNDTVTRGQTVTFLYRASGSPTSSGNSFADVAPDAYYANAVAWAVSEGITSGTGNNAFSPDADCTRGQIVTFMYRNMA
ncbi:leucine-rich repeat protein [Oscillibacter sp.]|uniref:leucine-rich repeat protein n=1 Tax=Oscillibacter sp. TaxID=1945593 RepID=UPI00258F9FDF|nr:leucine-rich repeat protein [Oscillibacter sp.]